MIHSLRIKSAIMSNIAFLPATELSQAIRRKQLSPVEVIEAVFAQIHAHNPQLNAFCTLTEDQARAEARAAEAAVMRGDPLGPLHGIPISIKDLFFTKDVRTMRGSRLYQDFVSTFDAPVVERTKRAGAIVIGKTTTPEFGYKGLTDSAVTGMSYNPWDASRSPGGSSGGAAAAVATGMGPLAVGTDGAGSIRIPASFCGIFGLKPTHGRVPIHPASAIPLVAHAGPMTRTVADAALLMSVLVGRDDRDIFSQPADDTAWAIPPAADSAQPLKGLRIAWSADLGYAPVAPEIAQHCAQATLVFADLGATLEEANPGFADPQHTIDLLWACGMYATLGSYLSHAADKIDPGLVNWLKSALGYSAADYAQALVTRASLWEQNRQFFDRSTPNGYDLLITPTMPTTAFAAVPEEPTNIEGRTVTGFGYTPLTYPFNITGQPAATLPCGFAADGLPIGLQIVGRRYDDLTVLRACAAFEAAQPWSQNRPTICNF